MGLGSVRTGQMSSTAGSPPQAVRIAVITRPAAFRNPSAAMGKRTVWMALMRQVVVSFHANEVQARTYNWVYR